MSVDHLLPGMILLEDMVTDNKSTLLAKGTELTEDLLVRVKLYTRNQRISRPIYIIAPEKSAQEDEESTN